MYEDNSTFISPLFYVGIIIFIMPVVFTVLKINGPSWWFAFGMCVILLGAGHTMYKRGKK
jgi:hypothetical protein